MAEYCLTTDLRFYSSISSCPLPIKCLKPILKSSKISGHLDIYFKTQSLPRFSWSPLILKMGPGKQHQPLRLVKQS